MSMKQAGQIAELDARLNKLAADVLELTRRMDLQEADDTSPKRPAPPPKKKG